MDIAKYAGLFFLRKDYLYLPGLGNLIIKREPSTYSSELGAVQTGKAMIIFKPVTGVIDDAFANFVANNERVSIASAANAISEFGTLSKQTLTEGGQVELPGIGHFVMHGDKIDFLPNENLDIKPRSIPVFKNSTSMEARKEKDIKEIIRDTHFKEPTADEKIILEKPKVNYLKIIILVLIALAILSGIGYLAYYLINQNKTVSEEVYAPDNQAEDNENGITDSTALVSDSVDNVVTANVPSDKYDIIVNEYKTQAEAERRLNKLKSYNYIVRFENRDSMYYIIVTEPANNRSVPIVVDSIRNLLNPNYNVRLLQ